MTNQTRAESPATGRIILSVLFVLAAALAFSGALDKQGENYTNETLKRTLAAFAIARGLNGVISVAQGTEVAIQPAGVGVNFAPGEILDPINDLIERFSWVMLLSSTSLGVQQILLSISTGGLFTIIAVSGFVVACAVLWIQRGISTGLRQLLIKLSLALMIIRFAVPLVAIANEWIYTEFLSERYAESTAKLNQTTEDIRTLNKDLDQSTTNQDNESLLGSMRKMVQSASSSLDLEARLAQYKESASAATEHAINLIVVFVFQAVVLPLGFLWLIFVSLKRLFRIRRPFF